MIENIKAAAEKGMLRKPNYYPSTDFSCLLGGLDVNFSINVTQKDAAPYQIKIWRFPLVDQSFVSPNSIQGGITFYPTPTSSPTGSSEKYRVEKDDYPYIRISFPAVRLTFDQVDEYFSRFSERFDESAMPIDISKYPKGPNGMPPMIEFTAGDRFYCRFETGTAWYEGFCEVNSNKSIRRFSFSVKYK